MHKLCILSLLLCISALTQAVDIATNPFARMKLRYTELNNDFYDIDHLIKEIEKTGKQIQMAKGNAKPLFDQKLIAEKMKIWQSFKKHFAAASKDLESMNKIKKQIKAEKKTKRADRARSS